MKVLLLAWLLLPSPPDTLSLEESYRAAWEHFPPAVRIEIHDEIAELRRREIGVRFRPSLAASGQAVYHSDVPVIPIDAPGLDLPSIKHDQYRVSLDLTQLIYDGGAASGERSLEAATARLAREQVESDFQRIREQVNQAFFAVLLQDAAVETLETLRSDVTARRRVLEARIQEGVAAGGSLDVLDVDLLRIEQQITEAALQRRSALAVLGTLMGRELPDDVALTLPDAASITDSTDIVTPPRARPEYAVFEATRGRLEVQKRMAKVQTRPSLSGSASVAYGRPPGLNLFENQLSPFYMAGLQVRWPLFRSARRNQRIIDLQQEIVDTQEAAFTESITAASERDRFDVLRLEELLRSDLEIIARRDRIAERAGGQLDLGVISATDYLIEEHARHQARLTYDRRRIELAFARVRYLTTLGLIDDTSKKR